MLEYVAMPDVTPYETLEANNDPRHHSRIGAYCVFPSCLVRIGRYRLTSILQDTLGFIDERLEVPAGPESGIGRDEDGSDESRSSG